MKIPIKESLYGKNILVTGATGYIGPQLCNKLVDIGCNVYAAARRHTSILDNGNIHFKTVDFTDLLKVREYIQEIKPSIIFHFAGQAKASRSVAYVQTTFQSNFVTAVNIFTAATEQGVERIIVSGSMEEPDCENSESIASSPYAVSKWAATAYAKMFYKLYSTPIVILRLFMVYGPGKQHPDKLIPHVINSYLKGKPPELSSGSREIDWIYIDDVIDGVIHTAIVKGVEGQTIDIGSGKLISIRKLVKQVGSIMKNSSVLQFGQLEDRKLEEVKKADIEKTEAQIYWKPKVNLEEGLRNTIDWYKSNLNI